jgi:hypothetical protein
MSDTLTESVARLYRAGSEHSKQTEKLRLATDKLLEWILKNVPDDIHLPCNCKIWPDGTFKQFEQNSRIREIIMLGNINEKNIFEITIGQKHSINQLQAFCKLIADDFIEKLGNLLHNQATTFDIVANKIGSLTEEKK